MPENTKADNAGSGGSGHLELQVAQKSDVGLVRSENQDFAIVLTAEEAARVGGIHLMIVADGMGGHRGGATASRMAATIIRDDFLQKGDLEIPDALRQALEHANAAVLSEALSNADLRGMGTTCSALAVDGTRGYIAHVGDSRIYLIRQGQIRQVTQDHSLVATMVREGLLSPEEAEVHPRRNVLQRSVGVADKVEVELTPLDLEQGDTLLLCSDGLHGLVKEQELLSIASAPVSSAVENLVKKALERGAHDNVTVIVARVLAHGQKDIASPPRTHPQADDIPTTRMRLPSSSRSVWFWLLLAMVTGGMTGLALFFLSHKTGV